MRKVTLIFMLFIMSGCKSSINKYELFNTENNQSENEVVDQMMEESNVKKQLVISNVNFNYREDSSVEVTFDVKNNNEVPISFLNIQFQGVNEFGNVIDTRAEQIIWRGYLGLTPQP